MAQIQALLKLDFISIIIGLFIIMLGVKEIITLIQFFLKQFGIHTKIDDEKEKVEERFKRLEAHDDWDYQTISEILENMKKFEAMLNRMDKEQKERTVASYRSTMYRLHKEFMEKGYLTQSEIETFSDLADIYTRCGGNHVFADKIIPEVMALPIREN